MTLNKPSGWEDWINTVQLGDCLKLMKQMPEGVVHCVVTSPPYYGLRDYGTAKWEGGDVDCDHMVGGQVQDSKAPGAITAGVRPGVDASKCKKCGARRIDPQLGLEKTPEEYIAKMVEVFREVKRIMHPTATLWLNMGDSYVSQGGPLKYDINEILGGPPEKQDYQKSRKGIPGLKPKDLLEMPSRLVLALQADGWWLRCRIPWLKRNAMPESVQGSRWERHRIKIKPGDGKIMGDPSVTGKRSYLPQSDGGYKVDVVLAEWKDCPGCPKCDPNDGLVLRMSAGRPTQAVEYVFLLTKSAKCFYDGEAVRVTGSRDSHGGGISGVGERYNKLQGRKPEEYTPRPAGVSGRSRRNSDWFFESWQGLWTDENGEPLAFIVNPKPYKRSHFATFPPGLVIPCIRAGTSERGCCPECKGPWVRILQTKHVNKSGWGKQGLQPEDIKNRGKYSETTASDGDRKRIGYDVRLGPSVETKTLGWRATCSCGKEPVPCLAFDPFAGTGTVIEVARKMGRSGLGFEISEEYVKKYCAERLAQGVFGLTPE